MVQGLIYDSLKGEVADFLHEKGFKREKRSFKMFAFSRLLGNYNIDKTKGIIVFGDEISLIVSSPYDEFCNSLASNMLLKKNLRLGENTLEVVKFIMERDIVSENRINIKTLSPIVAYSTLLRPDGRKYTCYFEPGEKDFCRLIENNLRKKYEAFYKKEAPDGEFEIRQLHKPKMSVMSYKQTVIKGYSGRFELSGSIQMLQMAVDAGLGSKNSQGFGCIRL